MDPPTPVTMETIKGDAKLKKSPKKIKKCQTETRKYTHNDNETTKGNAKLKKSQKIFASNYIDSTMLNKKIHKYNP